VVDNGYAKLHQLLSRVVSSLFHSAVFQENTAILLQLDNVMVVTYANKMGGTHSQLLCDLAFSL